MGVVEVRRTVPTALGAVWDTVTDFAAYGRWIPLTSMRTDPSPVRLGWGFAGFTGVGPVGFLDTMLVVRWEPPADGTARFAVRKTGRVLRGFADVTLTATDTGGTDVVWREEIVPRPETLGDVHYVLVHGATEPPQTLELVLVRTRPWWRGLARALGAAPLEVLESEADAR